MNRFIISNNQKYDLLFYTLHLIVEFEQNVSMLSIWGNINHRLHETSLCFILPTYVEMIFMRWLHDSIYNETLSKSMEWTLITILSRNFKFDRHFTFEQGNLRVCLPKANTSKLSTFQVEALPENPVSMEGFYK